MSEEKKPKKHEPLTVEGELAKFSEVIGYPIEMKVRRKLQLKPGDYAGEVNNQQQAEAPNYAPAFVPLDTDKR